MWFKKEIQIGVYLLYLRSIPLDVIASHFEMDIKDVDEIIDYMNEIYN